VNNRAFGTAETSLAGHNLAHVAEPGAVIVNVADQHAACRGAGLPGKDL